MAILLKEKGLLDRTNLCATDFNKQSLDVARCGIYSLNHMQTYTSHYVSTVGIRAFSDHCRARHGSVRMDASFSDRLIFSPHNLVTVEFFGEMQMVICKNILIYFDRGLQDRVFQLCSNSLCRGRFPGLGSKESVDSDKGRIFETIDRRESLFKKGNSPTIEARATPHSRTYR